MNAEQIGDHIAARLALVREAQGAETDLGTRVYRGRRKIEVEQMPCAVLVEGGDVDIKANGRSGVVRGLLQFALHAYVPCDPDNPNTAGHAALRDLTRAVFADPDTAFVRTLTYRGRDILPRADGTAFVLSVIEFSAEFVEDLANP